MSSVYKSSDIIIQPSLWPEPLPRVLLEATYFGKPIIATDSGGNKEFINFLGFSLGSLSEVESQLFRAIDRNYISNKDYELISDKVKNLRPMIISFSNYLRNSGFKGPKWKVEEPEGIYTKPKNQNPELKNQNLKPGTVNPHPKTLN